jgi:hypothetical protein
MSSPNPVPSKAALHALRGLIFGTSCSLVLIAEERRRRISFARKVVENGKALKSVRCYNPGGSAAILASIQDDIALGHRIITLRSGKKKEKWLDENVINSEGGPDLTTLTADLLGISDEPTLALPTTNKTKCAATTHQMPRSKHIILEPPKIRQSGLHSQNQTLRISDVSPVHVDQGIHTWLLQLLREHSEVLQTSKVSVTAAEFIRKAVHTVEKKDELPQWQTELFPPLVAACVSKGDLFSAARILDLIIGNKLASPEDWAEYRILSVIDALVASVEADCPAEPEARTRLGNAAGLFLKFMPVDPPTELDDALAVVKNLIGSLASWGSTAKIKLLLQRGRLWALSSLENGSNSRLTEDTIQILQLNGLEKAAISVFLSTYSTLQLDRESFTGLCGRIVSSVSKSRGYKSEEVLRGISSLAEATGVFPRSEWVVKLLSSHWKRLGNYNESKKLFQEIVSPDMLRRFDNPSAILSLVVEIALDGNDPSYASVQAESLYALSPSSRNDINIMGRYALLQAREGQWDTVRSDFEKMKLVIDGQEKRYSRAFELVLREYVRHHTWGEIESFLETYVEELDVPLNQYMVTIVADRHGSCRDIKALGKWLEFCSEAGFEFDNTFCSTILQNCDKHWNYGHSDLQRLYRKLKSTGLDSHFPESKKYIRSILEATDGVGGRQLKRQVRHLRNSLRSDDSWMDRNMVLKRMTEASRCGKWGIALAVYRQAVLNKMGFSSRCLRVAVEAVVHLEGGACQTAMDLIQEAHADGHDVSAAAVPYMLAQLDGISHGNGQGGFQKDITDLLNTFHNCGIEVHDSVYNRAARICLDRRSYRAAVVVCKTASERNGEKDLCYSPYNFSNLLRAYTSLHDYDAARTLMEQLRGGKDESHQVCLKALQRARTRLRAAALSALSDQSRAKHLSGLGYVEDALQHVKECRRDVFIDQRQELEDEALRIVCKRLKPATTSFNLQRADAEVGKHFLAAAAPA